LKIRVFSFSGLLYMPFIRNDRYLCSSHHMCKMNCDRQPDHFMAAWSVMK